MKFLGLLTILSSVVACSHGNDIYVSPRGNDSHSGNSLKNAFKTPQIAVDRAEPGDRVLFDGGTFLAKKGATMITIKKSGLSTAPIALVAVPGKNPILKIQEGWEAIKVAGASYIVIEGLTLRGSSKDVNFKEAQRESNNLGSGRTSGNGITITDDPLTKHFPTHIIVRKCDIREFPGGGLNGIHCDYITFENNVVAQNGFWSPYANSGINIYQPFNSDTSTDYKIKILSNVSFENQNFIPFYFSNVNDPSNRKITDGNGIILDDYENGQGFGGGAGKIYTGKTLVANNIAFDNGGSGIHVFKSLNVDVVHNYASNNNLTPTHRDGQIFANSSENVRVLNNILISPVGKPVNSDYDNKAGVEYDFNIYSSTDGSKPLYARPIGRNLVCLPGMELKSWADGGRTVILKPISKIKGAAKLLDFITTDFFGRLRSEKVRDIGPFDLKSLLTKGVR